MPPDDYESTARALALPIDDDADPHSPVLTTTTPPWHRRGPSYGRDQYAGVQQRTYKERLLLEASRMQRQSVALYNRLTPLQRILAALVGTTALVLGILFLVYNEAIFSWLAPAAERWHDVRGGWLVLFAATFFVSFPPLIGYSTCVTISGFVYGFPTGWFIVAPATVLGSTASFLASRSLLASYVARLVAHDRRFAALALTLKHDGLKLLAMIRLCPLPYSLSNGAIATFPTVTWANFALATALVSPKLLIHVFVGARLGEIARHGREMDWKTSLVNWASIVFGMVVGAVTGFVIWRQTQARARQLEEEEREAGAAVAPERVYEDAPGGIGLRGADDDAYQDAFSDLDEDDDDEGGRRV